MSGARLEGCLKGCFHSLGYRQRYPVEKYGFILRVYLYADFLNKFDVCKYYRGKSGISNVRKKVAK